MSFGWLAISALLILLPLAHRGDLWCEDPLMAVLCPIAGVICFAAAVLVPLSGMMITKKGTIVFLPDFRLKTFRMTDLKRVVLNFNECKNKKYSVTIKFIAENGKVFMNDYSVHFRNRVRGERLAMAMYTVSRKKVDRICEELSDVSICIITIIYQDQRIVYQTP